MEGSKGELGMVKRRDVPCNLCGSAEFNVRYPDELGDALPPFNHDFSPATHKTFQIVQCRSCGLVFTNPMPHLEPFYADTVDPVYLLSERQRRATARHAVAKIATLEPRGRLLDVGCGTGVFLDTASERYDVEGVELSGWAADIASQRRTVHRRPLSELAFQERFDVVTLWTVIEHLEDPRAELKAVHAALAPGGLVVIYTGDVGAWLARLLGKKWWEYKGMHLFYFSRRTLTRMLGDVGFDVVRCENHRVYFQLFSLAKSLGAYRIGRLVRPLLSLPRIRDIMIPLTLSSQMVLYARKRRS